MITAAMALEQNREVFAIPSAVDLQRPSGTNLLIKRGEALLVERPEELMHELEVFLPALREHREAAQTAGDAEPSSV